MNLLILSSGTRNKIIQYFKRTLAGNGNVICTDMSNILAIVLSVNPSRIIIRILKNLFLCICGLRAGLLLSICEIR